MRQQTENNISKPKSGFQSNDSERHRYTFENQAEPMLIAVSELSRTPVKYFDLVSDNNASGSAKPEKFQEGKLAAATKRNKRFQFTQSQASDAKELFDVLLFQLDQIVYLDEMRENLTKLEMALTAGKTGKMRSIASDCASLSVNCGMFGAVKPLRRLECLENTAQAAEATDLLKQVKKEFELFRFNLKQSIARIAPRKQSQKAN